MSNDTNERGESATAGGLHTVRHGWEKPFLPSVTIVEAVAAATNRTATELPPLQQRIDPDALDTLMSHGDDAATTVSFRYAGTDVVIEADGVIEVSVDPEQ